MNIEKEARKWIEDNYPLMNANNFNDCDELDVHDMISFAQHIKEKLGQRSNTVSLKRIVIGTERLLDALLCVEFIAMHQEELPKNLNTEKERELHAALNKIYRISHVARKPVCFDKHENWEKEFQQFIPVAKG